MAYFEIGNTNRMISNLLIESETFERNGKCVESKDRKEMAKKLKAQAIDVIASKSNKQNR